MNKFLALQAIQVNIRSLQERFDKSGDQVWKQAIRDLKLEYAMVVKIPDDDDFIINYAAFLLRSGLFDASEKRLANL